MRKKIALFLALTCLLSLLTGCGQKEPEGKEPVQEVETPAVPEVPPEEVSIPEEVPPHKDGYLTLEEILEKTRLFYAFEDGKLSLVEDSFQIDLFVEDKMIYRNGYITGSMKQPLAVEDGVVFLPEDFYEDFLLNGQDTASLYHGLLFFPTEIVEALDRPEVYAKVLEQVELPRSLGIETIKLDMGRIYDPQNRQSLGSALLEDEALWESDSSVAAIYRELQEAFAEKDIQPDDLKLLSACLWESIPVTDNDDELRALIEAYYTFDLELVRQLAAAAIDHSQAADIQVDRYAYSGVDPEEAHPDWWPNVEQFDNLFYFFDPPVIGTAKDGVRRDYYEDRKVWIYGNTAELYFDTFQVLKYYHHAFHPQYGLLNRDGDLIVPAKYPFILVPFADRYILFTGSGDDMETTQAHLYDSQGNLLAEGANGYSYLRLDDGAYIGTALQLHNDPEEPNNGNLRWFIDKNGDPIRDTKYKNLYFFDFVRKPGETSRDEAVTQETFRSLNWGSYGACVRDTTVYHPDTAFFYGVTTDRTEEIIPLKDILLPAS